MAVKTKTTPSKEVATVEIHNTLPDYLGDGPVKTGLEGLDAGDFKIPRLKLLQALSPEIKDYPGVAMPGQFWATNSTAPLGDTLNMVCCIVKRRAVLWSPKDGGAGGGGMLDFSKDGVHWNSPNQEFTVNLKNVGKVVWNTRDNVPRSGLLEWGSSNPANPKSPPAATLVYEYLVYLMDYPNLSPIVMNLYRTGVDTAKDFNTKLMSLRQPMQAVKIIAKAREESRDGNDFYMWQFTLDGFVARPVYEACMSVSNRYGDFEPDIEEEARGPAIDTSAVKEF